MGTVWADAGSSLALSASKNDPFLFATWNSSDPITFQQANQAQTTATINGAGTITAIFCENLTTALALSTVSAQIAGTSFSITVTAKDPYGNTIPWYTGTVHFTSTDAQAILPADYTFETGDSGSKTFTITLKTAGANTIIAIDTVTSALTVTSNSIATTHAAVAALVTFTPGATTITAGGTKTYTATATDSYGNTWDVTSTTTWTISSGAGGSWSSDTYTSQTSGAWAISGIYGTTHYATALIVVTGPVDHFNITAPNSATAGTAISITITAQDSQGNTVTSYGNTVGLTSSQGSVTPSTSNSLIAGVWTGPVTLSNAGSITLSISDGNSHTGTSSTIVVAAATTPTSTPTPAPTATPTPTPTCSPTPASSPTFIPVTTDKGKVVNVTINPDSNVTSTQISSAIITSNKAAITTTFSFNITGASGTIGFGNMTIAKSDIPYGTTPIIYIDGAKAQNQGYTEDGQSYYVWFTTHFSNHQVQVEFTGQSDPSATPKATDPSTPLIVAIVAVIVVLVAITAVFIRKNGVKNPFYYVEK